MANENKEVIINQFFGLGDILFIEPIYRWFHEQGYKVIAPVEDHYYWLMYYIQYVHFKKKSEYTMDYENTEMGEINGALYVPLRFSTPIQRGTHPHSGDYKEHFMLDKYRLLGLPEDLWRTLSWVRNEQKEEALYKFLGLKENTKYNMINNNFGGGFQKVEIEVSGNNIYLDNIPGFTLLDWAKVIINAQKIYTVETSLIYMVETLPIKAKEIHMYPRMPYEDTVYGVKNFISDKWILHEKDNL
jgi:hypothetical protein